MKLLLSKAVWSKSVRESFDQTLIVSLCYVEKNTITPISAAQLGLMKTIDDNENYQIFHRWLLPGFSYLYYIWDIWLNSDTLRVANKINLQKFSYNHDSIMNTIKSYLTPNLWMILQRWINLTMRVQIQNVSQNVDAFHFYRKM